MKQVIYVDVLVVLNIFVNYFLLLGVSLLLKTRTKKFRIIAASVTGGIFALAALFEQMNFFFSLSLRLITAAVLVLICFGFKTFPFFMKHFLMLFTVTFLFAGLMSGIWLIFRPAAMIYKNNALYFDVNIWVLILSSALCYGVLRLLSRIFKRNPVNLSDYDFTIRLGEKEVSGKALPDTGNRLTEIFSGYPVGVCTVKTARKLFGDSADNIFLNKNTELIENEEVKKRLRIVNCTTVSGNASLISFRPDSFRLVGKDTNILTDKIFIAVSGEKTYINEKYEMIINDSLLEREKE